VCDTVDTAGYTDAGDTDADANTNANTNADAEAARRSVSEFETENCSITHTKTTLFSGRRGILY
jgi:hypothetical protein